MGYIRDSVYEDLQSTAEATLKSRYYTNQPFPHIVLDNLFKPESLLRPYREFPTPGDGFWWKYENPLENKFARNDLHNLPLSIQDLINELQSNRFVSLLQSITGIHGLIVDHELNGGGCHSISRGGFLGVHSDYNYHPTSRLDRRINVLVYLNAGWDPDWGGNLELWNRDMSRCITSIVPDFNRTVIFNVTDWAYHGHPDPLDCPAHVTRKSIAMYYYTNGRPDHEKSEPHSTIFKRRPQDSKEHDDLRVKRAIRRLTL